MEENATAKRLRQRRGARFIITSRGKSWLETKAGRRWTERAHAVVCVYLPVLSAEIIAVPGAFWSVGRITAAPPQASDVE